MDIIGLIQFGETKMAILLNGNKYLRNSNNQPNHKKHDLYKCINSFIDLFSNRYCEIQNSPFFCTTTCLNWLWIYYRNGSGTNCRFNKLWFWKHFRQDWVNNPIWCNHRYHSGEIRWSHGNCHKNIEFNW